RRRPGRESRGAALPPRGELLRPELGPLRPRLFFGRRLFAEELSVLRLGDRDTVASAYGVKRESLDLARPGKSGRLRRVAKLRAGRKPLERLSLVGQASKIVIPFS